MQAVDGGEINVTAEDEIRFLPSWAKSQLAHILEVTPGWEEVMGRVPAPPWSPGQSLPQGEYYPRKYSSDDIILVKEECARDRREGFHVLVEEWGTSGRKRPTVADLIALFQLAKLYRAMDYLTVNVLHGEAVARGDSQLNRTLEEDCRTHQQLVYGQPTAGLVQRHPTSFSDSDSRIHTTASSQDHSLLDSGSAQQTLISQSTVQIRDQLPCDPQFFSPSTDHAPQDTTQPTMDTTVLQNLDASSFTHFPFSTMQNITNNFSGLPFDLGGNILGEGAFGIVFLAKVIHAGKERKVAIKKLNAGELKVEEQFKTEIEVLSKCVHNNLLSLVGYSCDGPAWCLIYDYMANGSLQDRLACKGGSQPLTWTMRVKIGEGAARGIAYLHTNQDTPLVHRDIKSANILLDKDFIPKVGDFGLVRLGGGGTHTRTLIKTTTVFGTSAYMAPEAFRGDISVKMDTFSYGIVLLELLTGLSSYDENREGCDLMALSVESLSREILEKAGVESLSDLASIFPTSHTTDAHIIEADVALEAGRTEDAFHFLSLSHSTLLHHRMTQKLYKPSKDVENGNGAIPSNLLEAERATLAAASKEDTLRLIHSLPSDWTVIQITTQRLGQNYFRKCNSSVKTPGLYISRCRCGPEASIIVKSVASPCNQDVRGIIQELQLINEEKRILYKEHKGKAHNSMLEDLQDRLKSVVHSMGKVWLHYWCCLLVGSLPPEQEHQLDQVSSRILARHTHSLAPTQILLLKMLMSCPEGAERYLHNWYRGGINIRAGVASVLGESVRSSVVKQLCTAIEREEKSLSIIRRTQRNPVILILDKMVESLPWEMVWVLREQPVTRMPSLRMLALLYQHHSSTSDSVVSECVNAAKGFYVLDPDNNLPRTVERLKPVLSDTGWPGTVASRPTHDQLKDVISTKDVFVYAGHGSGSQYLPGEIVESAKCRALVLLFGCRSVHLASRGRVADPWGVVLNYLVAYCPCVVGMLWDVTDKDTDSLTIDLLRGLQGKNGTPGSPLANPPTDVALLVARSRSLCRSLLTTAALAVYGLPLHLCNTRKSS